MKRLKAVLPSLREKKRYLAFEIVSDGKIADKQAVFSAIKRAWQSYLGELEAGKAGIMLLGECYNDEKQRGLIRVKAGYLDKLRASLCYVKEIDGRQAIVRSVYASGIIKKAKVYVV
jgi:ribonuclease P/MRP protein subunit POP5